MAMGITSSILSPIITTFYSASLSVCALLFFSVWLLFLNGNPSFLDRKRKKKNNRRREAPSPPSLPVIGHLHHLKKPVHRSFARLSEKYGPVLLLRFGTRPCLLVSSPSAVEECLTTHDLAFANRPGGLFAGEVFSNNYTDLIASPYGPHWRNLRRIATSEMLSSQRLRALSSLRSEEGHALVRRLLREYHDDTDSPAAASSFKRVELKPRLFGLAFHVIMRMVAGKRRHGDEMKDEEDAEKFRKIVEVVARIGTATNVADFLPWVRWIVGFFGLKRKMLEVEERRFRYIQSLIEEYKEKRKIETNGGGEAVVEGRRAMMDVMLSLEETSASGEDVEQYPNYTDEILRSIIVDLLTAGTDAATVTMEWGMSRLLNNPDVLKTAREEINTHVGKGRVLNELDLPNLPYLHAILKETFRLHPGVPLLLPHESSENTVISGYDVPKGMMLMINAWAIHRDEKVWDEPTKFKPERFLGKQQEGFGLIPFGYGRRSCAGQALATRMVPLALGSLIQCFEWERVGGEEIEMQEVGGLTMPRANPLVAMYKPREEMLNVLNQL